MTMQSTLESSSSSTSPSTVETQKTNGEQQQHQNEQLSAVNTEDGGKVKKTLNNQDYFRNHTSLHCWAVFE